MCKNGHTRESGQTKPIKINRKDGRKNKDINKEMTDADNAAHQTGQDNICARRKWQIAETVEEENIMRKCADPRKNSNTLKKHFHQQKNTTGTTTESKD